MQENADSDVLTLENLLLFYRDYCLIIKSHLESLGLRITTNYGEIFCRELIKEEPKEIEVLVEQYQEKIGNINSEKDSLVFFAYSQVFDLLVLAKQKIGVKMQETEQQRQKLKQEKLPYKLAAFLVENNVAKAESFINDHTVLTNKIEETTKKAYWVTSENVQKTKEEIDWDQECADSHGCYDAVSKWKTVTTKHENKDEIEKLKTQKKALTELIANNKQWATENRSSIKAASKQPNSDEAGIFQSSKDLSQLLFNQ